MSADATIPITGSIALGKDEIAVTFIRAGGPGGQNVNKVASAVQLRFDVRHSPSLPEAVRLRLERIAGARLTKAGEIVLTADRFRTQEANRRDAVERLVRMIRQAAAVRPARVPTRPPAAVKLRRLAGKASRATLKRQRQKPPSAED
jgi:ribosome-associated protein